MLLLNFFKNIVNIFYIFNFIFILGFFNILYLNEETIICISLIIFYFSLFFFLRKIILIFFFFSSELLYLIFFFLLNLNILYINRISKYIYSSFKLYFNNKKNIYYIFFKYNMYIYIYSILYFRSRFKDLFKKIKIKLIFNYLNFLYNFDKLFIKFLSKNNKNIDYFLMLFIYMINNIFVINQYSFKYNNYQKILYKN